jgi:hypothetical protein
MLQKPRTIVQEQSDDFRWFGGHARFQHGKVNVRHVRALAELLVNE